MFSPSSRRLLDVGSMTILVSQSVGFVDFLLGLGQFRGQVTRIGRSVDQLYYDVLKEEV